MLTERMARRWREAGRISAGELLFIIGDAVQQPLGCAATTQFGPSRTALLRPLNAFGVTQ